MGSSKCDHEKKKARAPTKIYNKLIGNTIALMAFHKKWHQTKFARDKNNMQLDLFVTMGISRYVN